MAITTILSRRGKQQRRIHSERRRQVRASQLHDRRKSGGRRESDYDVDSFAYNGT